MAIRWIPRLAYAWRRHGPIGFVRLAHYNLRYHARRLITPSPVAAQADTFDLAYGTDTSGIREISTLDDAIALPSARSAVRYEASREEPIRAAIETLGVDYTRSTFVDFGSGKGRVLLVAAGYPFKGVVGVEFSQELHRITLQNIARFPPELIEARTVSSVHADAASFALPASDIVGYLYNPFGPEILARVAAGLASHGEKGYYVTIIYVDPRFRDVFEQTGKFEVFDETPSTLILVTRRPPGPAGLRRPETREEFSSPRTCGPPAGARFCRFGLGGGAMDDGVAIDNEDLR
jgi:SAM-dependent methyltransferase